ncbi:MAG: FHA domain-containing protein [Pseudobdellovibrionaceae bacterium]
MSAAPKTKNTVKFNVEVAAGPHAGLKLTFDKPSVTIGRGPENDIVLSSDPRVSRQHAEIKQRSPTEFVILNLSSKNFVLMDGQNIQSEILAHNSVIQIGDTEIHFKMDSPVMPEAPAVAPLSVVPPIPAPAPAPTLVPPSVQAAAQPVFSSPQPLHSVQPPTMPQGFHSAPPYHQANPGPAVKSGDFFQNPKARFYGIIIVMALVGWFLISSDKKISKDSNAIRSSSISMKDVAESEKRNQELLTIKKEKYDSVQYRRAQENFVKGFRDFQQGQYARAREAFQVVLNLDPDNELAKRYFHLSKIKFDELVKFNMMQGNRYREKRNWRMCQSNYSNVMTMLQYRKDDPSYKEAKQYYEECTLNVEGRY